MGINTVCYQNRLLFLAEPMRERLDKAKQVKYLVITRIKFGTKDNKLSKRSVSASKLAAIPQTCFLSIGVYYWAHYSNGLLHGFLWFTIF